MGVTKKLRSSNKEDILQALAPLNQHVLDKYLLKDCDNTVFCHFHH